jgi:hypothetical protein
MVSKKDKKSTILIRGGSNQDPAKLYRISPQKSTAPLLPFYLVKKNW